MTAKSDVLDGNTVYALEQGKRIPRLDTVEKLAYALGISPAYLAYGIDGECPQQTALLSDGLGARLQAVRLSRGLNLRELGLRSDTSHTTVRLTERGETIPNLVTAEALARALGVSPGWLAYGIGPQELTSPRRGRPLAPSTAQPG